MPLSEQRCCELATAELREQSLGLTQQFMSVHKLIHDWLGPVPAGIVASKSHFDVYFQPVDERYFIVLSVADDSQGGSVVSCRAEARCKVYLSVKSDSISPEEVTAILGLAPTRSWRRGEPYREGSVRRTCHAWFFEPTGDEPGECDRKLGLLLDKLDNVSSRFALLPDACKTDINVVYEGYKSEMWGIHWNSNDLVRVGALGADLDVDIYASGPDLPV